MKVARFPWSRTKARTNSRFSAAGILKMLGVIAVLTAFLPATSSHAAAKWIKVKTSNFELLTPASERNARSLILHFEQVKSFFAAAMPDIGKTVEPLRIVAFDSEKDFRPYSPYGSIASAFYASGPENDFIVMRQTYSEFYPVAVHEYVHLLVRRSEITLPLWLNEGLAELYSTLEAVGNKVQVGDVIPGRYQTLMKKKWIDLAVLAAVDHASPYYREKDKVDIFYAESWALTHMLVLSELYRPRLGDFISLAIEESDAAALFSKAFGKSISEVEQDLHSYSSRSYLNSLLFDIKLGKAAASPEISPASDLDVRLALANILIGSQPEVAAQKLAELNKDYPGQSQVEQALGYLCLRNNDRAGAREHFGRAIDHGASQGKLYLDYSSLLRETGVSYSVIVPIIEKAVRLEPENKEAIIRLAEVYDLSSQYQLAIDCLAKIQSIGKDKAFRMFMTMAHSYAGLKELGEAKKAADRAALNAGTPSEQEVARDLIADLTSLQTATAAPRPPAAAPQSALERMDDKSINSGRGIDDLNRIRMPGESPNEIRWVAKGDLQQIECLGKQARLHISANGKKLLLLIVDPNQVIIKGRNEATVEFQCGPQPNTPVVITYRPKVDAKLDTSGEVVAIEFP